MTQIEKEMQNVFSIMKWRKKYLTESRVLFEFQTVDKVEVHKKLGNTEVRMES